MRLLQLQFVLALLGLPLMLHLALNLFPQLVELLLSILADYLLPIGVLIFDSLLLRIDFLLLSFIFFSQSSLQFLLRLFLLFIKSFSLLAYRVSHILLDLALALT